MDRKQLGITMGCMALLRKLIMTMAPHPGVSIPKKRLVLCPLRRACLTPLPRFLSRWVWLPRLQHVRWLRCTVVLVPVMVLLIWCRLAARRTFIETVQLPLPRKVCTWLVASYMSQGGLPGARTTNLLSLTWHIWSAVKNPWVVPVR